MLDTSGYNLPSKSFTGQGLTLLALSRLLSSETLMNQNHNLQQQADLYEVSESGYSTAKHYKYFNTDLILNNTNFVNCISIGQYFYEESGGAIFVAHASLCIHDCIFKDNKALFGGAILCYNCSIEVDETLFEANQATQYCGAIYSMALDNDFDLV